MEFPTLGKNCGFSQCNQLDFLPMKCDACFNVFCNDHIMYASHSCPESYKKDKQVPVCPLCNAPIPIKPGQVPDVVVGGHIDTDCQSNPAQERRKVFTNQCRFKKCKQKELMPILCSECRLNFCIKHRHPTDHNCIASKQTPGRRSGSTSAATMAAKAASSRYETSQGKSTGPNFQVVPQQRNQVMSQIGKDMDSQRRARNANAAAASNNRASSALVPGAMSEDEQFALALQRSLEEEGNNSSNTPMTKEQQEAMDRHLARQLERQRPTSERQVYQQQRRTEKNCTIS